MESDQLWETIPQDILTQVFKYLPVAPERWNCLFVNKAFHAAMQSRLLWTHITFQDCSVMPQKRGWDAMERTVNKPKKPEFITAAFLAYLKKNHRDVVVELDLSYAALESEGEYLPRKCNISYSPEYNEDHMNTFWGFMFDFPNLKSLSLFSAFFSNGSMVTFGPPANKNLRSSVRNLNLIKQNLFYHTRDSFKTLMEVAPELEVLQVQDIAEENIELEKQYPKLKQLLFVLCNASARSIFEVCPNLEVFINHRYDNNWGEPEEPPKPPGGREKVIFISGERKPLRELSVDDIVQNISKAIVNVRYSNNIGLPQLHDLVKYDQDERLEVCLKTLKLDPNIKFRTTPDVVLDPFVLMYPYDSHSDDRGWDNDANDIKTLPALLENGDTPLHYAVKRRNTDLVRILLENGADPNSQNKAYRTPLCYAHTFDLIELLIEHGASINIVDKDGWNLLMNFIANKGRLYPSPLEEENIDGHISFNSASKVAAPESRFEMFNHLIDLGCDINYQSPSGLNALKIALSVDDEQIVEYLLKHMKEPLVEKSPCIGLLSCVAATEKPNLEIVEKLLSLGADPTIVDERGQTYLHVAAERNHLHLLNSIEHITKDRAKLLTMTDAAGFTCLHYAVLPPKTEVVWECDIQVEYLTWLTKKIKTFPNPTEQVDSIELFLTLLASDGVLDVQASSGETSLLLACRSMTSELRPVVVQRLLTNGANPNVVDHDGGSPLIAAAYALDLAVVTELIDSGAYVTHCDKKGINALLAATLAVSKRFMEAKSYNYRNGLNDRSGRDQPKKSIKESEKQSYTKIFKLLLDKKIPVNQQEKLCGLSVLHLLAALPEDDSIEWITSLVKDYNADIDLRSLVHESPLHYAIRNKSVMQVKTLLQLGADVNARGFGMLTPLHYVLETIYGIHALNQSMTDDLKLCLDGYKIVANTMVRYPAWMWSSPNDRSQSPQSSLYEGETDQGWIMFMDLFRHAADKLDFNAKSFLGYLPLHNCWVLARNIVDPNDITKDVAGPKHYILSIPLTMLKYATRDQLLTKNLTESTPFDLMLSSPITVLKPSNLAGTYPSIKEGFNLILKRCIELVGDTIDINHVINAVITDCEYSIVETLTKQAKENGKFTAANIKKSLYPSLTSVLNVIMGDAKLYALFKAISGPLWSTRLDREPPKKLEPMIFNFMFSYQSACGYDDKATRPKMFDSFLKSDIDWTLELEDTKENLLLAVYSWWRNAGAEALLYNQVHNRIHIIEGDKIIADLIKVGVDPHKKNILGQSFADMVPQYEKVVENTKYLTGEEKRAIQKESYFVDKKPSLLAEFLQAITHS